MNLEPTVFVVDDDADFRDSLEWVLGNAGLKTKAYPSAEDFLEHCQTDESGCVLLDVKMPGMGGLELQERLTDDGWCTPVIFLTAYADVPMAVRAMEAGAAGFIEKPFSRQDLLDRVKEAIERDTAERSLRLRRGDAESRLRNLTPRQRQVMEMVVAGMSTKKIARVLRVSARTVEVHRARLMKTMQANSVADLVAVAVRYNLCDPDAVATKSSTD